MPRFKHIQVGRPVDVAELTTAKKVRAKSARQLAIEERDQEIRAVINEAAAGTESQAFPIQLRDDQKLPTMRAAVARVLKASELPVKMAVRGTTIYLSRGNLPGRGGRR